MSATTSPVSLPSPEPDEPSDVTVAIEAARALWENGDREEALRWFSRAAEAAEQAGNDRRALDLARAVADLRDSLAPRAPAGPPPLPPAASVAPAPPAPAAATKSVTRPPPPPRKSIAPTPPSMRPRAPEATTAKSFTGPPDAETRAPERSEPPPAPAAPTAPAKVAPVKATPEPRNGDGKGERLRVSVKSSVRDPNLLLVRILGTGQAVPSGCHEAFLSAAQSGIDLRSPRE